METFRKYGQTYLLVLIFLLLTFHWFNQNSNHVRFFGDFPSIYAVMALAGGVLGIKIAQEWGGFRSIMGKAIWMFSLGLLLQVFGQIAYAYLAFFKQIEVPYPSIGDIGYFSSIPLYIYGVILLAKASGVTIALRSYTHQMTAVLLPLVMLIASYLFFLRAYEFDWSAPVRIFLDFGYPLGQSIYISLAILTFLLSRKVLGGIMKNKIRFLILALLVQYIADYTFLFQVSKGTWVAGGIDDYMYLCAYFLMSIGLIQLNIKHLNLKSKS